MENPSLENPIYDVKSASAAQQLYCEVNHVPMFAPKSGICWHCGMNLFVKHAGMPGAYSVQRAAHEHITECPYCMYSYCD